MKRLFLSLMLLPALCQAQKIKIDSEIDKFTKERRIQTSEAVIYMDTYRALTASYRSVGADYFLSLTGKEIAVGVIGEDDKLIFLLDNDSTVSLTPTGIQTYDVGNLSENEHYSHQYYVYQKDLEMLSTHDLKSVRRYFNDNYRDIDIKDKRKGDLKNLTAAFVKELQK